MTNELYEKNLKCLQRYNPLLLNELLLCEKEMEKRPDAGARVRVVPGRRGLPTFLLDTDSGRSITGHSVFDPVKEAEKKFADCSFSENERIVLLGFGFGYEVRYLLSRMEHPVVVVLEPYVSVFRKAMETVDLTDIFEAQRLFMSFSLKPEGLKYVLMAQTSHLALPDFKVKALPHVDAFGEFPGIVSAAVSQVTTLMTFNMMTGLFAGPVMQNNLALNFPVAMKHPGVNSLAGCFRKKPVFVVAPGPSLSGNAEQLKRVKDKAFVIACDTAVNPLLRMGIEPDGIISIDYQPANFFKLRGVDTSFAYLFPALEVSPYIPLNHKGRMFNYYHSNLTECMFGGILGPRGTILSGGSVLTDAFSLARLVGADPIILVGVDLGFPGMKWYADGCFDGGRFTRDLREGKHELVEVEDIYGNPMTTYKSFYEFITWFGAHIPLLPDRVIDATEGGAKLEHSEIMKLSEAIDEFVKDDFEPPAETMEAIYRKYVKPAPGEVVEKIDGLIGDFEKIERESENGAKHCRKAAEILETSKALVNNKELIRLLRKINEARQVLMEAGMQMHLGFLLPMMERQIAGISYMKEDEALPKNEKYLNLVNLDLGLYERVRKACGNITSHFKIIREEILLEDDKEYV